MLESLFSKERLRYRCFPVKFVKFLRAPVLKNICEGLLLNINQNLPKQGFLLGDKEMSI